ncbi:hypothetical protein [Haloarchaeobius amylolyticus]|uniref:hypothetical protein n=1 Tax=Haloarchaeobius amylolyticus TaxID=1198296 RepID=UPI00226F95EC|nr:hypothetical protein [Haloarchaeobius amylolyticus]
MRRRTLLSGAATGIALLSAGCTTSVSVDDPGASGTDDETTDPATDTMAPTTQYAPNMDFRIVRSDAETVKLVHMEGKQVEDDVTEKVTVTVDGEPVPVLDESGTEHEYLVADDSALGENESAATTYPVSTGNRIFVEASAGSQVAVVWYGEDGRTAVLEEETVD